MTAKKVKSFNICSLTLVRRAALTQHRHASSLAGEIQQGQQLVLAGDAQLRHHDRVSGSGEENPAQLPGCTNQGLLIRGRGLVNWSLWRGETKTGSERKTTGENKKTKNKNTNKYDSRLCWVRMKKRNSEILQIFSLARDLTAIGSMAGIQKPVGIRVTCRSWFNDRERINQQLNVNYENRQRHNHFSTRP